MDVCKQCRECGQAKNLPDFYANDSSCKECRKGIDPEMKGYVLDCRKDGLSIADIVNDLRRQGFSWVQWRDVAVVWLEQEKEENGHGQG